MFYLREYPGSEQIVMLNSMDDLPWFSQQDADQLVRAFNNNHAVLLNGLQGIGKSYLALMLARALFADSTTAGNHLIDAGTHPDIHVLTSAYAYQHIDSQLKKFCFRYLGHEAIEKKRLSRQIGVDTIRALVESMNQASSSGGCKLAIIYPVEHLNINAANAILKFLEEPTSRTFLILISHDISRLTPTLRSRCMRINIVLQDNKPSVNWLKSIYPEKDKSEIIGALELAGFRPLIAAEYLSRNQQSLATELEMDLAEIAVNHAVNLITIARKWTQYKQTDFILSWICQYFTNLIKVKLLNSYEHDSLRKSQQLERISKSFSSASLFNTYDYLKSLKHGYDGIADETLLIEDVLQTIANNRTRKPLTTDHD